MVLLEIPHHYSFLDYCFQTPTLQTPQPKSLHQLIHPQERSYTPETIGTITTNPSPSSSSLCSASFIALRDDDTKSIFTSSSPSSSSSSASSSSRRSTPDYDQSFDEPPDVLSKHKRLSYGVVSLLDPNLKAYAFGYLPEETRQGWGTASGNTSPSSSSSGNGNGNVKRKTRPRYAEVAKRDIINPTTKVTPDKSNKKNKKSTSISSTIAESQSTTPPLTTPLCRPRPAPWWPSFHQGIRTTNCTSRKAYARRVFQAGGDWTREDLLELCAAFVSSATNVDFATVVDGMPEADERVVLFACCVYDAFQLTPWNDHGGRFGNAMRDAVIGTFTAVWHKHEGQANRALAYVKDPSQYTRRRAASALMLSSFVGDLYRNRFLHRNEAIACVRVLLKNATLFEHVTAMYNILRHAGIMMWQETDHPTTEANHFLACLTDLDGAVKDSRVLICPSPLPKDTIKVAVSRLKQLVEDYVQEVVTGCSSGIS